MEAERSKRATRGCSEHEALGRDLGRFVAAKAVYGSLESIVKLCSLRLSADCHCASYCRQRISDFVPLISRVAFHFSKRKSVAKSLASAVDRLAHTVVQNLLVICMFVLICMLSAAFFRTCTLDQGSFADLSLPDYPPSASFRA